MNKLNAITSIIILCLINSCGNNNSLKNEEGDSEHTSESTTIIYNGTTYRTVISPYTGRVWLDRNLGAARVCESFNDTACYGDYYQWGRNFDGHQDSGSTTTNKQAIDINNAGSEFILDSGKYRDDWANDDDINGDKRMKKISSFDGTYICPKNFRIPSVGEFIAETSQSSNPVNNNMDAYENFLKLPSSGLRIGSTGRMRIDDTNAFYTVSNGNYDYGVDYFYYAEEDIGKGSFGSRVSGMTVRCIKNN